MAILADQDRVDVWANVMRRQSVTTTIDVVPGTITKQDLRAAVDAIDQWISDNAASFNSAVPQPARSALTASQKAALFTYVLAKRFEKGT